MGGVGRKSLCAAGTDGPRLTCGSRSTPPATIPIRRAWGGPALVHLLARALDVAGHQVLAPSEFRTDVGPEEGRRQAVLERRAVKHATRLVASYRDLPSVARPEAWLTCRLHQAAPDLIGAVVAETLGIPYLLVGASCARPQAGGANAGWHAYAARAIARAHAVLSLTAEDEESIRPLVASTARLYRLAPFLDPAPYQATERDEARRALAQRVAAGPRPPVAAGGGSHAPRPRRSPPGACWAAPSASLPSRPGSSSRWATARRARWWRRHWRRSGQTAPSLPAPAGTTPSAPPTPPATSTSGPPTRKP